MDGFGKPQYATTAMPALFYWPEHRAQGLPQHHRNNGGYSHNQQPLLPKCWWSDWNSEGVAAQFLLIAIEFGARIRCCCFSIFGI